MVAGRAPRSAWLEVADAYGTVRVEAEDFVEGKYRRRRRRDNRAADDGHLALIHVTAPDCKAAVDDCRNPENKAEHHDNREAIADAGFEIGRVKARALGKGLHCVKRQQRDDHAERTKPRDRLGDELFHTP